MGENKKKGNKKRRRLHASWLMEPAEELTEAESARGAAAVFYSCKISSPEGVGAAHVKGCWIVQHSRRWFYFLHPKRKSGSRTNQTSSPGWPALSKQRAPRNLPTNQPFPDFYLPLGVKTVGRFIA